MLLLLLLGCPGRSEVHCELSERAVADDEALDLGYSVDEALAQIDVQTVDARDLEGNVVPIEVTIGRGEGDAVLTDAEEVEERIGGVGPTTHRTWLPSGDQPCQDVLTVPVSVTIRSADEGTVAVYGEGALTNLPWMADEQARTLALTYDVQETDALPTAIHGAANGGALRALFRDGVLVELTAEAFTGDGIRETVLWYGVE